MTARGAHERQGKNADSIGNQGGSLWCAWAHITVTGSSVESRVEASMAVPTLVARRPVRYRRCSPVPLGFGLWALGIDRRRCGVPRVPLPSLQQAIAALEVMLSNRHTHTTHIHPRFHKHGGISFGGGSGGGSGSERRAPCPFFLFLFGCFFALPRPRPTATHHGPHAPPSYTSVASFSMKTQAH